MANFSKVGHFASEIKKAPSSFMPHISKVILFIYGRLHLDNVNNPLSPIGDYTILVYYNLS